MNHLRRIGLVPAALLIGAGCSTSHPSTVAPTTAASTTPSTTASTVVPATTPAATSTTLSAGGSLPARFTVTDLSWVSATQGWALGTAPCAHPPCTSVTHTLDGGQTWAGLPAPRAYLTGDPQTPTSTPCSVTVACVEGIRFADANNGYAFGDSSLWLTTNGGHTWTQRSADATDALEVTHGLVVRVTHPEVGCPPGCPYRVQAAPAGSTSWQTLPAPAISGYGATLAVEGANLYVAAFGHTAGGAQDAHTQFLRSTDNGAHWSAFADPCGVTPSGREADTTAVSAAPGGYLAVGCTPRATGEAGFVVLSADAGATFGPHRGNLLTAVPANGEQVPRIAAATGSRLAVLVSSDTGLAITVTNDAGADWTTTHTESTPSTRQGSFYLGFQDDTTGRAVLNPRMVLTTTDGGGHWTAFTFP
ncbi:MAG: hypothetical protein M3083_00305 [Actinomycetota bacterium]|nr:hypothetical protein [Actinomycetota bacterium]